MSKKTFIQVGVTAMRSPMGDFLPSIPIYIEVDASDEKEKLTEPEEELMHNVAGLFAERFKTYYENIQKEKQKAKQNKKKG